MSARLGKRGFPEVSLRVFFGRPESLGQVQFSNL